MRFPLFSDYVYLWAGNTLTMITAIARFERTHTVSRVEAIVYLHKYNENKDPSDFIAFPGKWAITQSYNGVFGSLLEMRTMKTDADFC